MASTQVIAGESVAPFGLHVTTTAQLRDEDGIVTNGLSAETQVQVRGYQDQDGALWMTRVRERGNPDPVDTSLRAPVSAINGSELSVLGLTVDTSQAVFFDIFENPITTEQFFAALQVGDGVDVATATWIPEQSRLIAGEVSIAKQIPAPGPAQRGSALGIIGGTASGQLARRCSRITHSSCHSSRRRRSSWGSSRSGRNSRRSSIGRASARGCRSSRASCA